MLIPNYKTNHLIEHPGGGFTFGAVPPIPRLALARGQIHLRAGMHRVQRGKAAIGFGLRHIWEGKKQELAKRGIQSPGEIPTFITKLVRAGTEIFHDFEHPKASMKRITLLRLEDGTLVLEPRDGDRVLGFHYQIVTWTPRTHSRGVMVGFVDTDQR